MVRICEARAEVLANSKLQIMSLRKKMTIRESMITSQNDSSVVLWRATMEPFSPTE